MFQLDMKSRRSIYEQVMDNIKELIITQVLTPEEKLPSVRELSKQITVNPNTVQKAYRELEHEGYLYTVSGLGCFVCPPQNRKINPQAVALLKENLKKELNELLYMGLTHDEIFHILQELLPERRINP